MRLHIADVFGFYLFDCGISNAMVTTDLSAEVPMNGDVHAAAGTISMPVTDENHTENEGLQANQNGIDAGKSLPAVVEADETSITGRIDGKRKRLPYDRIGQLEDEIDANPDDPEPHRKLIAELKKKEKVSDVRDAFNRFLVHFPTSATILNDFVDYELSQNNFQSVEQIFTKNLRKVTSLSFWRKYLDYVRRCQDVSTGGTRAIEVITQSYEFVLAHVGYDIDSGPIWREFISFIKTKATSTSWEEQQKIDAARRTYIKAVTYPLTDVESIWKEYDHFENSVSRSTARKLLAEVSPAYMSARAAIRELRGIIDGIRNDDIPARPTWSSVDCHLLRSFVKWIEWEENDPLGLDDESAKANRIRFALKQATMTLRYYPEIWYVLRTSGKLLLKCEIYHDSCCNNSLTIYCRFSSS